MCDIFLDDRPGAEAIRGFNRQPAAHLDAGCSPRFSVHDGSILNITAAE
jgi:hypothetical protein